MNLYIGLIALGVFAVGLSAYLPVAIPNPTISVFTVVFASVFSLLVTFVVTKKKMEEDFDRQKRKLKRNNEKRIRRLKQEQDTTMLEKTIRDGTQTLIKNALDYFKIENIKNEIGTSAAIENLQLDKYGQIIELLADFSLILPDIKENKQIVEDEINHQIKIYQIDENPFALFLQRIMKKYTVTVNKKIREKIDQDMLERMKHCPQCAERVLPKAKICKHCGHKFEDAGPSDPHHTLAMNQVAQSIDLIRSGKFKAAVKELDSAIEMKSDHAPAFYTRAVAYSKLGNKKQAMADMVEASQLGHKRARMLLEKKRIKA